VAVARSSALPGPGEPSQPVAVLVVVDDVPELLEALRSASIFAWSLVIVVMFAVVMFEFCAIANMSLYKLLARLFHRIASTESEIERGDVPVRRAPLGARRESSL
jgi:hypothetical protein